MILKPDKKLEKLFIARSASGFDEAARRAERTPWVRGAAQRERLPLKSVRGGFSGAPDSLMTAALTRRRRRGNQGADTHPPRRDPTAQPGTAPRPCKKISVFGEKVWRKKHLTFRGGRGRIQSNFRGKPLNKRSKRDGNLSESRGWWDHGRVRFGEWTCEGRANGLTAQ